LLLARPGAAGSGQGLNPQSAQILLNRAEAGTCSGCHQTAPREGIVFDPMIVKVKPDGSSVTWPDVVPGIPGFVHVDEGRALSVALEEHFLPVRRYMMGRHLCKDLPTPTPAPGAVAASYVTDVLADQFAKNAIVSAFSTSDAPVSALSALPAAAQEEAVAEMNKRRDEAREAEQNMPGAFVEVRRSH
jgi:hypothetical protein